MSTTCAETAHDDNAKKRAQREWNVDKKGLRRDISQCPGEADRGQCEMGLDGAGHDEHHDQRRHRPRAGIREGEGRRRPVQWRHRWRGLALDLCQPDQLV